MPNTETDRTEIKLSLIAGHAARDRNMKFTSLAHLLNVDHLRRCFKSLDRNKAKGADNVSWYDYNENLEENLIKLVEKLKKKSFKPVPALRVYINKEDGRKRPLGISAIENKIVEKGMKRILEAIYEQDFLGQSHGFRPKKGCHTAIKELNDLITFNSVNHIVECDIKGFFDNVSHEKLMEFLRIRIADTSLLYLIEKFLKAGYIDDGMLKRSENGTPQGSIISPIFANIYLHYVLDVWFEKTVKTHVKGFCELVRYADDFVCVVQFKEDAKRIERAIQNRMNKYGLEIHPDKSSCSSFGKYERENAKAQKRKANTFDFLGFTHYCTTSRKGRFKIGRKTQKKKYNASLKRMNLWLKMNRNKMTSRELWKEISAKLNGHYQYYGVSENSRSINNFYHECIKMIKKWLERRSQKSKITWENYARYLEIFPLPKPSIKVSLYDRVV